jgi:repressor LexA
MLTRKQHELICFIHDRLADTGISPSFEEMKEALDLKSKSGVHRLISALEERGFLRRLANRARALEVVKMPERGETRAVDQNKVVNLASEKMKLIGKATPSLPSPANDVLEIPLHGRIAAGLPIEALEGQSTLAVPAALLGAGEHFALEVSGDSMVEAGILDGDYALIRKADAAREGEIIVALVDDEEATLKYFRREGSMVRLDPANRSYEPQRYSPDQIRIQGRLAGLLRRY